MPDLTGPLLPAGSPDTLRDPSPNVKLNFLDSFTQASHRSSSGSIIRQRATASCITPSTRRREYRPVYQALVGREVRKIVHL
jgi:hypothetical protein